MMDDSQDSQQKDKDGSPPSAPHNSNFKQQRLRAVFPVLTERMLAVGFLFSTVVSVALGALILVYSDHSLEVDVRYDHVRNYQILSTNADLKLQYFAGDNGTLFGQGARTDVVFDIPRRMNPPVYLYYRLVNFYQNHRSYRESRNQEQLAGFPVDRATMFACVPFRAPGEYGNIDGTQTLTVNGVVQRYSDMRYNPCGLVAWSLFNDTFVLREHNTSKVICNTSAFMDGLSNEPLGHAGSCTKKGIAWPSDTGGEKFKAAKLDNDQWTARRASVTSTDRYHAEGWYHREPGHKVPHNLDEDLHVWMRTAALSDFKKILRVVEVPLEQGPYLMSIDEYFDVASFDGEKHFVLLTRSWVGGRNQALGIVFIALGGVTFLCCISALNLNRIIGRQKKV